MIYHACHYVGGNLFIHPSIEATTAPTAEQQAIGAKISSEQSMTDGETSTAMAIEVSFSNDIWPVIQEFALTAHGQQQKGGVSLASYDDSVNYVVPGDPTASELYKRLTGDSVPFMPPTGKLPNSTIQLFYDLITQGPANN